MKAIVYKPLGNIQRMDIVFRLEFIREYAFVHAGLVIGEMIMAF